MKTSDKIEQIIPALLKAKEAFAPIHKTAKAHQYKYAPLDEVLDSVAPALLANGLALVQGGEKSERQGIFVMKTRLFHSSGEWIETEFEIAISKNDPQGYGSVASYSRRYALLALLGLAPDSDDDAAAAMPTKPTAVPQGYIETDRGMERSPEAQAEINNLMMEFEGIAKFLKLTKGQKAVLFNGGTPIPLYPEPAQAQAFLNQINDFMERQNSNQLTDKELKIIGAAVA